jgi:MFS family permease
MPFPHWRAKRLGQWRSADNAARRSSAEIQRDAFGKLIGPPLAGFIIDHTGGYRWAVAAALAMASAAFLVLLPLPNCELPASAPQKIG